MTSPLRAATQISIVTLGSRVLGLVRDVMMFRMLGFTWAVGTFALAWMIPNAPLANRSVAMAMSSTSMFSWAKSPVWARISATGPINQVNRSTLWMAWFISAPPPSSCQVPRHAPLS